MRAIDAENIRIKPEFMHSVCGLAMIRVEDVVRILNDQPTIQPAEPKKREMNIEQEKMIVEALPSLYPLKDYEEDAIHTVLEALPHWIPVTERLPERSVKVLTCDSVGDMEIRSLKASYDGMLYWESQEGECERLSGAIAWMPLPEPMRLENK